MPTFTPGPGFWQWKINGSPVSPKQSWALALRRLYRESATASDLSLLRTPGWWVLVCAVVSKRRRDRAEIEPSCRYPLLWWAPKTTGTTKRQNLDVTQIFWKYTTVDEFKCAWVDCSFPPPLTLSKSLGSRCSFSRSSLMWRLDRKTRWASWWICRCWLSLSISEITSLREIWWENMNGNQKLIIMN